MTRTFVYGAFLMILVLALSAPYLAAAGGAPSDDIKRAANEGIAVFLKDSRIGGLHRLGFESRADIDSAELGEGFQIFTIHPSKLLDESVSMDFQSLVAPTNQWKFLVVTGDKANALLEVNFVDGKWIPVGIGASVLAKELSGFLAAWPASSGYQYRFIRVYQATSDLLELSLEGKVLGIIPLTSLIVKKERPRGVFDLRDLRAPSAVLMDLRPVVRQNMQMDRDAIRSFKDLDN
ncbi:MAG: hypothetical protein NDI77_01775 [Geobacteraceae bacterium]|nr:hypothetical protein [Geobacteraceae bacterium]